MKNALLAAVAVVALPAMAQAQAPLASPGFYIGAEGGLNWLMNFTGYPPVPGAPTIAVTPGTGWLAGGVIGYDFVGPRVELEGVYRQNPINTFAPGTAVNGQQGQLGIMANLYYDFLAGSTITPYVGAGAGLGLVDGNSSLSSTVFAFQGIVGVGWNVDSNFRINLDGRYYGTTNPTLQGVAWNNNNLSVMLGLQLKFGPPAPPAAPPPAAFKAKGNARITATGHTDTVKDALVRDGVPATACASRRIAVSRSSSTEQRAECQQEIRSRYRHQARGGRLLA